MSLKLFGLTPRGSEHADVAVLAKSPDPANIAYEALREAEGKKPAVQEVVASGPVPQGKVRVPNLTGATARQALKSVLDLGLSPKLSGSGLISSQTPGPGELVDKGASLSLVLEPAS
jgi:stage V sporulation protein D (sporulation-specific penicillin-binding protein)